MHRISEIIHNRNELSVRSHTHPAVTHAQCDFLYHQTHGSVFYKSVVDTMYVTPFVGTKITITTGRGFMIGKNSQI